MNSNKKINLKYFLFVILVTVFIIIFPILLEKVILKKSFLGICFKTKFTVKDWFSFWGSYVGAVGTIVLGYIALRQNKALSLANDALNIIQKEYLDNITMPSIRFQNTIKFEYSEMEQVNKNFQNNINTKYPIVFKEYKDDFIEEVCWHTNMSFYISSLSHIPLTDFKVEEFIWTLEGKKYLFEPVMSDRYCKLPFFREYNVCSLNVIYPDLTNKKAVLRECGERIQFYVELSMSNPGVSKLSTIRMKIAVRNQMIKERHFEVELDIEKIDQFEFRINKYFLKPLDM